MLIEYFDKFVRSATEIMIVIAAALNVKLIKIDDSHILKSYSLVTPISSWSMRAFTSLLAIELKCAGSFTGNFFLLIIIKREFFCFFGNYIVNAVIDFESKDKKNSTFTDPHENGTESGYLVNYNFNLYFCVYCIDDCASKLNLVSVEGNERKKKPTVLTVASSNFLYIIFDFTHVIMIMLWTFLCTHTCNE